MTHSDHHAPDAHANRPNYFLVFVGLFLLTIIEVGITYLPIPQLVITISLVAFMVFKVLLVAMFYMHLKMDSKWFSYLFLIPLPFVALIMGVLYFMYYQVPR